MSYLLLFCAAVLAEIASVVIVGGWLGWWTLAALAGAFALGLVVLSGRGLAIVTDVTGAIRAGSSPTTPIVDGALIAVAGLLLLTPGFASDLVALALLVPPVRGRVRDRLIAAVRGRLAVHGVVTGRRPGPGAGDVIDVDATEVPPPSRPRLSE
ncbi:MAG: FxsA family protein [Kofleriaceae bacterium]